MHMILIRSYLKEPHLIAFLDFQTHILHDLIDLLVKYCLSIFCGQYQMIQKDCYIMAFMDVFAHFSILRRKRRGIQPVEIKIAGGAKRSAEKRATRGKKTRREVKKV